MSGDNFLSDDCYRGIVEVARVSVRDLSRNTAEVLDRVAEGETIEITRNGIPIAVLSPPDPTEVVTEGLIKAGILSSDWRAEQAELKSWILANQPLPAEPGKQSLSETLIEMREEEAR